MPLPETANEFYLYKQILSLKRLNNAWVTSQAKKNVWFFEIFLLIILLLAIKKAAWLMQTTQLLRIDNQ